MFVYGLTPIAKRFEKAYNDIMPYTIVGHWGVRIEGRINLSSVGGDWGIEIVVGITVNPGTMGSD